MRHPSRIQLARRSVIDGSRAVERALKPHDASPARCENARIQVHIRPLGREAEVSGQSSQGLPITPLGYPNVRSLVKAAAQISGTVHLRSAPCLTRATLGRDHAARKPGALKVDMANRERGCLILIGCWEVTQSYVLGNETIVFHVDSRRAISTITPVEA